MTDCLVWAQSEYLVAIFRLVSWFGDGLVPVALVIAAALYFYFIKRDWLFALILGFSALTGQVIKALLKGLLQIGRPETEGCIPLTTYRDEFSLPSGHVIFYVIFFGLLVYYYSGRWRTVEGKVAIIGSVILIAFIGLSRIYLRAHWYTDVLAGYLVGGAILLVAIMVYNRFSMKKTKNSEHKTQKKGK